MSLFIHLVYNGDMKIQIVVYFLLYIYRFSLFLLFIIFIHPLHKECFCFRRRTHVFFHNIWRHTDNPKGQPCIMKLFPVALERLAYVIVTVCL